ncbi:MAG: hypothetical protein JWR05_2304 [Mucilaginibacter sp.]|nr:hypothetical protein [Mucilaginibacter sp.]
MRKLYLFFIICCCTACITVVEQKTAEDIEKENQKRIDDNYNQAAQALKNIEDSYHHVKGINPDTDIPITNYKLYTTEGGTTLQVTFKNKSVTPLFYVEFTWRLFDKNGKEVRYKKDQWGGTGVSLLHGQSDTEEWMFDKVPLAKTAEIKFRKTRLADTIRDYSN